MRNKIKIKKNTTIQIISGVNYNYVGIIRDGKIIAKLSEAYLIEYLEDKINRNEYQYIPQGRSEYKCIKLLDK